MSNVGAFFKEAGLGIVSFFHRLNGKKGWRSFLASVICVVIGLLCGLILMLCIDANHAFQGFGVLLSQGFVDADSFGRVLYQSTPMMLSGVAIAFAFKLGLFNIGITGQVTIGAFTSLVLGLTMQANGFNGGNWIWCMLIAMVSGALVGLLTGYLKAKFNVNEVLSGIMLNWIIYYSIGLAGRYGLSVKNYKDPYANDYLLTMPSASRLPSLGIQTMLGVSWGLIIAILIVVILQIVLNKTVFGFELKLSGSNRFAAQYAGVSQSAKIIWAMTISGACAGICGYMLYALPTNPTKFLWSATSQSLLGDGFTGISVSLIAQNSPIGCIFSSILLSCVNASQTSLKSVSDAFNIHYTELIKSIIIYIASFSSLFVYLIQKGHDQNKLFKANGVLSERGSSEQDEEEEPAPKQAPSEKGKGEK
jgi:ABC-type uncharacterized transport system permease subunit